MATSLDVTLAIVFRLLGVGLTRHDLVRGIARQTLRQKLRDLGLHVAHAVEADEDDRS